MLRHTFALLECQHIEINEAVADLMDLLERDTAALPRVVGEIRTRIMRLVAANMQVEEERLFGPLRRFRLSGSIPCYTCVIKTTRDLRLQYSAHISTWPARAIAADWQGYKQSTIALHRAATALRQRKVKELYPAAERLLSRAETRDLGLVE